MRVLALAVLVAALVGCTSINAPSASPTQEATPTPSPTQTPAPTLSPTPAEPTQAGTPDPNATPRPTLVDLLPFLSSQITVVNLADEPLTLTVTLVDPDSTDEYEVGTFEVQPLQVTTQSIIPSRFRLDFDVAGGSAADVATCTIDIAEGEQIQFAVVPTGVAMSTSGIEPEDPAEMVVATSSRCRAGADS